MDREEVEIVVEAGQDGALLVVLANVGARRCQQMRSVLNQLQKRFVQTQL